MLWCFRFTFCFYGFKACGILAPWPGTEPTLPALEDEVLTTEPLGKLQTQSILKSTKMPVLMNELWLVRIIRRRQWQPTPVLLPGKSHGQRSLVGCSPWGREMSDTTERLHFHFPALEKEMATHSSVLAWRIPGMAEPGGLPSMGSHRVGHDWSNLATAAAAELSVSHTQISFSGPLTAGTTQKAS